MKTAIIFFCIGFAFGWLVFQRPQWMTDLIDKVRAKVGI